MPGDAENTQTSTPVHVLAIEDDAMLLQAICDYLKFTGYRLTPIHYSGPRTLDLEGLKSAGAPPDVIVCDYHLPGNQNGIDIIASIRALFEREIPAILFTGDVTPITADKAAALPASKMLLKPVPMKTLAEEIEALVKG